MARKKPVPADRATAPARGVSGGRRRTETLVTAPDTRPAMEATKTKVQAEGGARTSGEPVIAAATVPEPRRPAMEVAPDRHLHALVARAVARVLSPRIRVQSRPRSRKARLIIAAKVTTDLAHASAKADIVAIRAARALKGARRRSFSATRAMALTRTGAPVPEKEPREVPATLCAPVPHTAGRVGAPSSVTPPVGDPAAGWPGAVAPMLLVIRRVRFDSGAPGDVSRRRPAPDPK